jgi:hypothetical protein
MPLFFALSALFIHDYSWPYVIKRALQLMVPFYFFVIIDPINLIFHPIFPKLFAVPFISGLHLIDVIKKVCIGSGFYLQNALWFLPTLFVSNILFAFLYKYRSNKIIIGIFLAAFCLLVFFSKTINPVHYIIPYGVDIVIYILPLVALVRYVYFKKNIFLRYNIAFSIAGIIISSALIWLLIPPINEAGVQIRLDLDSFIVPDNLLYYLFITALSVFIFLLFLKFNKRTVLSTVGQYTLPIFIFHTYPWFEYFRNLSPYAYLVINVLGSIILGIALSKLLMRISPKFKLIGMVA